MTKQELEQQLEQQTKKMGLFSCTYNPGDGMTRYCFSKVGSSYFASNGIPILLGLKKATTWLNGYTAGYYNRD